MADKKSDLLPRVITAVVAIPLLFAIIFLAPPIATFVLLLVAGAIGVWEFCDMIFGEQHTGGKVVATALAPAPAATMYFAPAWFIFAIVGSAMALFIYFLFAYREQREVSHQITASITGILYAAVMLMMLGLLHRDAGDAGPYWFLLALVVTWSSDTGAYFSGKAFGSRKLYEAVSPNKSVEGAVGGLLASVGAAFLCNYLFGFDAAWTPIEPWQVVLLAVPANILGQIGDLAASLIKRAHDIKDSGVIIYGHGGILDRIDALIFAAPWFYIFYTVFIVEDIPSM